MSFKSLLLLILLAISAISLHYINSANAAEVFSDIATFEDAKNEPKVRTKRGIFWDFFQKMVITKNLVVDQYVDTKNTLNEAYNLLNEGFSDPGPTKPTLTPTSTETPHGTGSTEMTKTTEKYPITRYELGRILGRNFRGLQRLTKIELQDAFNQSHYNIREYQEEARKQFANSLGVEAKDKLKTLKG